MVEFAEDKGLSLQRVSTSFVVEAGLRCRRFDVTNYDQATSIEQRENTEHMTVFLSRYGSQVTRVSAAA